jgi:hypothetical protein
VKYQHGTRAAYVQDKCRCDDCRRANREYQAHRTRQQLYGRTRWHCDVDQVRDHIAALRAAGYGTRTIADLAGINRNRINHILHGRGSQGGIAQRPPSVRILKTTAAAILAIEIPTDSGIDEIAVERVLNGDGAGIKLNRAERLELVRRWKAAGRSLNELERRHGWNTRRDLKTAA